MNNTTTTNEMTKSQGGLNHRIILTITRWVSVSLILAWPVLASSQTTTFTYQGRFTDGGTAANGTYDMQFKLFDGASNQIGSTITNGAVTVSSGVFTVQLNFGGAAFSGADRFLEIGVRVAGSGDPYTVLAPVQQLTSAVYAIRASSTTTADTATSATTATNATQLGGIAASQYVLTTDPRLSNSGSGNYIQNTTNLQASSNFNISGNGTAGGTVSANIVNATAQYNLGGDRILSVSGSASLPATNTFAGVGAGADTTPDPNGLLGAANSFFGERAGNVNTTGYSNSFFGIRAGLSNTTGFNNTFLGDHAGIQNTTGNNNIFIGPLAGKFTKNGAGNLFIGSSAGEANDSGTFNTAIGYGSDVGAPTLTNATAIGYRAMVSANNSLVLGSINGVSGATADTNVGIGLTAPLFKLHVKDSTSQTPVVIEGNSAQGTGIRLSSLAANSKWDLYATTGSFVFYDRTNGRNGAALYPSASGADLQVFGALNLSVLKSGGNSSVCFNTLTGWISQCSSSLRYKTNIHPFIGGLSVLNRLHPITFDWKQGGMHDLGFGAEDIAAVEPLLVTRNDQGEVEGVKYDRISAVLVNAVKEQQQQITEQQEQIKRQQGEIESLTRLVCRRNRRAAACR